jgi:hypothetical protein
LHADRRTTIVPASNRLERPFSMPASRPAARVAASSPLAPSAAAALPESMGAPPRVAHAPDPGAAEHRAWLAAVLATGALVAVFLAVQAAGDRRPFGVLGSAKDVRIALLHCVMAGFFPAALWQALHRARTYEAGAELDVGLRPSARLLGAVVVVGLVGGALGPYLMEPQLAGPLAWWRPSRWSPETAWHRVLGLWAGVWSAELTVTLAVIAVRAARVHPPVGVAELLDPRALAAYTRLAVGNAMLAVTQLSIYAAFAVDFGAALQVLWSGGVALALAALALSAPLLPVHRGLRAARRAELAWCDAELPALRRAVRAGAPVPGGRLADLEAYRAAVARASEWAADAPLLRRVALYLLLPLGSWIASSLVQHVLERYVLRA